MKYVFVSQDDTPEVGIQQKPIKFYQICAFPNPKNEKYEVRVVKINDDDKIISFDIYSVTKETKKKLLSVLRANLFKIYATFTLDGTKLPSLSDISTARSKMINDDNNYSGFAPF